MFTDVKLATKPAWVKPTMAWQRDNQSCRTRAGETGSMQEGIAPLIAVAKAGHHPDWRERHSEPPALPENATPLQAMAHRLKTKAGRALYALRKQTVEPVFGIIKSVMGFRQFSLRGLAKVTREWTLVCLAWNLKRLAVLRLQE